jgi:hypothetical protein
MRGGLRACRLDQNALYIGLMHREAKEILLGLTLLSVFGVALIVWRPLGVYIHDAIQIPQNLIASLF